MAPIPRRKLFLLRQPDLQPLSPPLIHAACQEELNDICQDAKQKIVLKSQLNKRMLFYYAHLKDFDRNNQFFEFIDHIKDGNNQMNCYSCRFNHVQNLGNLRILFVLDEGTPCFLYAFQEKRKLDYKHGLDVVRQRLKEIEG